MRLVFIIPHHHVNTEKSMAMALTTSPLHNKIKKLHLLKHLETIRVFLCVIRVTTDSQVSWPVKILFVYIGSKTPLPSRKIEEMLSLATLGQHKHLFCHILKANRIFQN